MMDHYEQHEITLSRTDEYFEQGNRRIIVDLMIFSSPRSPLLRHFLKEASYFMHGTLSAIWLADLIVYLVDSTKPNHNEIEAILTRMSSKQLLFIVVIQDINIDKKSRLAHLVEVIGALGGIHKSELTNTKGKWFVWCLQKRGNEYIHLEEMIRWIFAEAFSSKLGWS